MKKLMSAVNLKILLAIGSFLGLSGFVIIVVVLLLSLVIAGAAVSVNQNEKPSFGGQFSCSPTGELNIENFTSIMSSSGALAGYENEIISISEEKGIDPVLFAAIALHESAYGKSNAILSYNNPGGLMNPATGSLFRYATLSEGLQSMGRTLYNRIRVDGLTTIEKLGSVYAPVGAANDPTGLNQHWVPNITEIASKLGGLTMNCEPSFGDYGDITGVEVVDVGRKWIGNSKYKFGGGRNQSDIESGLFDCSSFVHWAFSQVGINLGPLGSTTTDTLKHLGQPVPISDIQPGDLVFFDTYKIDGHVGIYVGNGKFIGAQSSTGVAIADMSQGHWKQVFNGRVKRILQ